MKKIIVFGGAGLVGSKFIELYKDSFEIKSPPIEEIDILNKDQLLKVFEEFNPDVAVNFAAFTNVEQAESEAGNKEGICYKINVVGAKNVAEAGREFNKHVVHISTEYVFDGTKEDFAYNEKDKPNPVNWYGQTKYLGEVSVQESGGKNVVVRISMPYSPYYELKPDVARFFLKQLKDHKPITAIEDQEITPTLVSDIGAGLKTLINAESTGLYHVSISDSVTPIEFVKTIARLFNLDYSIISPIKFEEYNKTKKAKLLKYSWLNPAKFEMEFGDGILHTVEENLTTFKEEIEKLG